MEDMSGTKEDDTKSLGPLPKIMEDMSMTEEEHKTSQIPLPKITYYTELQYKDPNRRHRPLLKLLHLKSAKSKKSFPKTREQETNTTIQEKLSEVYLKSHRRNTIIKQMNFMKNDFLKELVMKEDLKYLILEILPKNEFFFLIDQVRIPTVIEGTMYDDIQDETLSVASYKVFLEMMSLYAIDIDDFMYDYHIILNIRKYVSQAAHAQPVFSSFILLKPTNMLLIKLTKLSEDDRNSNPLVPDLESLRKESEIFSEVSGPLYLDTSPLAKEFINFLREYRYEFDSDVSNHDPVKEGKYLGLKINLPPLFQYVNGLSSEIRKFNECLNSPMGLPMQISGNTIKSEESWRERLKTFLEYRKLKKPDKDFLNQYELVEIFTVKFAINSTGKTMPAQRFISVFYHHDGTFKFCTTLRLFKYYMPRYPDALFIEDGDKQVLDRYIFEVLSFLNRISACGLKVTYSNLNSKWVCKLYTGDKIDIKAMNKESCCSNCCFQKAAFPDVRKKYLDAVGYNESANQNNFVRQQVLVNGGIREFIVKVKKTPYVLDAYLKMDDDKYNRKPEEVEIEAGCFVQNGNLRTAFEAHKFEKSHRYPFKTHGENGDDIRYEFYPSLSHTYKCSKKDYMDAHQLTFTDNMKKFLDLCSKGEVRPHYLYHRPRRS